VVDTGPEFRIQAIRAGLKALDLLLITHSHADHLHGLDDVRPLTFDKPLDVFANGRTCKEIKERFSYIWNSKTQTGGGLPHINVRHVGRAIRENGLVLGGIKITPLPAIHGRLRVLGWKFEEAGRSFVYLTDVSSVPGYKDEPGGTFAKTVPCELLIIGAIKIMPHKTHFSFGEALDFAKEIYLSPNGGDKLAQVYFTHLCHNHNHIQIENYCTAWLNRNKACRFSAAPAFDGLEIIL